MKRNYIYPALLLSVLVASSESYSREETPVLEGPYLGQKPPGLAPEVFAFGIVSLKGRQVNGISFSPDLNEVFFSAEDEGEPDIYFSKLEEGRWTAVRKTNFTKGEKDAEMQPFVSYTGKRIYFTAHNSDLTDTKIWYVNRLAGGSWSSAIKLDSPINDEQAFYANEAKNGDLFYTNVSKIKMNYAPIKNGDYPEVREVGIEFGVHGFIAPSQDFLVVNAQNRESDERKDHDIYVYFKGKDGTWGNPVNLGDAVNSNFSENTPSITPDGKYLFFCRKNESGLSDLYWVSAKVIENLGPKS